jgi:phosphohistidine phosphatase SixA
VRLARRAFLVAALLAGGRAQADEAPWARLRQGGLVLLMRHARTTPGVGDPPGFRLDDCATQRNLDAAGREQARAVGDALRRERVPVDRVLTSAWCRCRETAELLGLGAVEPLQPLDSVFRDGAGAAASREGIRAFAAGWRGPGNALLVTHQVNISGAYGTGTAQGEIIVVAPDAAGGEVIARLPPPG